MSEIKENRESLDEIVFENRNKAYGAYEIRKHYKKNLNSSLFIVLIFFTFSIGIIMLMSFKEKEAIPINPDPTPYIIDDYVKPDFITPPPSQKDESGKIENYTKFDVVKVVDNINDIVELPSNDNIQNGQTTDNDNYLIVKDSLVKLPEIFIDDNVYEVFIIEEEPEFPGGDKALQKWIKENTIYHEIPKKEGITGKVYLSFIIDKDGKVIDVKIIRGLDPYLDKEAVKVVSNLPLWIPGKNNGEPVKVLKRIDIKFVLK